MRFIFSHSALREGWDNPNVFVICTLKHSDNTISRRQEVGRGMRLSRQPERRPHRRPGHRAPSERADGGGERELQGLRRRIAEGHQRLALRPAEAWRTRNTSPDKVLKTRDRRREGHAADGEADRPLPREERLHRRPTTDHRGRITRPRRKARSPRCRPNWSPTRSRSSS